MTVKIDRVRDFNLDHTFDCGQCFRWMKEEDGSYTGIAGKRIANIDYNDDTLYIDEAKGKESIEFWQEYLDLNRDYGEIKRILAKKDEKINAAINYGSGIRILQQDKWETIISFIISQNNNIGRIKGCIDNLSNNFGEFAGTYRDREYFTLPSPKTLSKITIEELDCVKLGYRAKYLIETGKKIEEDGGVEFLEEFFGKKASPDEKYEYLTNLCGVGPKVANCIMLFAMKEYKSFPIDVWVRRVMNRIYGFDEKDIKGMRDFARENYLDFGGFAQQYLFYYIRSLEE